MAKRSAGVKREYNHQQQQQQSSQEFVETMLDENIDEFYSLDGSIDESINHSLKISRHFISLLEDYRYILDCFLETCSCHTNFDHQFFVKKMEQRYNKLSKLVSSNEKIANLLFENDETFEQLEESISAKSNQNDNNNNNKFIKRIRIIDNPKTTVISSNKLNDETQLNYGSKDENSADFSSLTKFNNSFKGTKIAYKCIYQKCEFICFNQENLSEHIKNHNLLDVRKNDPEKRDVLYVCDQCGKEFAGQKWLENHVDNVHTYARIYSCDYDGCGYQSKFRCVIEDHKRRHNKTKDFKCIWEGCTSEFVTKRDMLAHVNFFHKNIRNYVCNWPNCDASFKDSNRLKHHLYTHTGERPYKCDFPGCDASFKQTPHLHKHKRSHRLMSQDNLTMDSELTLKCRFINCSEKFSNDDDLYNHLKIVHNVDLDDYDMDSNEQLHNEGSYSNRCKEDNCNLLFTNKADLEAHYLQKHSLKIKKEDL